MRILLIKPKHIGDTLVLTPTIAAIRHVYPKAEIWVLVRRGCEGILAGCPGIARILTLAGVEKGDRKPGDIFRQIAVLLEIWNVTFDFVFELGDGHRGRLFAMLARTKRRCSVKPLTPLKPFEARRFSVSTHDWQTCHRVEKDFHAVREFLPFPEWIGPLVYQQEFARPWTPARDLGKFAVVQVGSRQGFARWQRENWRDVGRALLERFPHLVITCGPAAHEVEDAAWLQEQLGPRVVITEGRTSWPQMAWLLGNAKLYVGPSTAAMHLAAARGCPVVAVFGPTVEEHWHPWQVPYRIVTSPGYVAPADPVERISRIGQRRMDQVEPATVIAACRDLLEEIGE